MSDDDDDWHDAGAPDVRDDAPTLVNSALGLLASGVILVFGAGVAGLCVRLFRWAAWE